MSKKCSSCAKQVNLTRTGYFGWNADPKLRKCVETDEAWEFVDDEGNAFGCQSNPHMRHNVSGLLAEYRRNGTVIAAFRVN